MTNPFAKKNSNNESEKEPLITQEQIMDVMEKCYEKSVNGIPGSKSCEQMADEYLNKYKDPKVAVKKFIHMQIAKCSTSGFVTGLGGIITLPVTLPANIVSVLYIQLRMIAVIASIGGYDVKSDEVQTLAYICLVNSSVTDICKQAGINIANKTTAALLKKLPGSVLTKINQKVGFRLLTKFGEKGAVNLVKLVPVAGGLISAGFDFAGTKLVASKAYKTFILGLIDNDDTNPKSVVVEPEIVIFEDDSDSSKEVILDAEFTDTLVEI